jgi:hypothetical protein
VGVPDSHGFLRLNGRARFGRRAAHAKGRASACRGPCASIIFRHAGCRRAHPREWFTLQGPQAHHHSRGRPPAPPTHPRPSHTTATPALQGRSSRTRHADRAADARKLDRPTPVLKCSSAEHAREERKKTGDGSTSSLSKARLSRERVSLESVFFSFFSRVREKDARSKAGALSLSLLLRRERARERGGDERERRGWLCDRRPKKSRSQAGNA